MATESFTLGNNLRYEASERARVNGVAGIIWVKRIKAGSGWCHDGRIHMPLRATRRQILEQFGQVYKASDVKLA